MAGHPTPPEPDTVAIPELRIPLFGAVVRPLQRFFSLEASGGVVLVVAALAALVWANISPQTYEAAFEVPLTVAVGEVHATLSLRDALNDGLMTLFFFVVGMEIKRELVLGELRTFRRAALPAIAALGGMIFPALIYLAFNRHGSARAGWGVPIATDIAFCIGVLTLLRSRIPQALIVFLTALAIFDDIGGIAVIAVFYGHGVHLEWLGMAALAAAGLFAAANASITNGFVYAIGGTALWYALLNSGIHPTIAGVVLGLTIPARPLRSPRSVLHGLTEHSARLRTRAGDEELDHAEILLIERRLRALQSPLTRFVHMFHPFVAFGVMPAFALANSGIPLLSVSRADLMSRVTIGTALGLLVGKQLGIFLFTASAVLLGFAPVPGGASWTKVLGVCTIGGIGFTVALFIATLGFGDPRLLAQAKLGIVLGSAAAAILGILILRATAPVQHSSGQ
jgi:NhaA family Na+:H+ antiporter